MWKCPKCETINNNSDVCYVCGEKLADYPEVMPDDDTLGFGYDYHEDYVPSEDSGTRNKKRRKKKRKAKAIGGYITAIVILGLCLAVCVGLMVYFAKENTDSTWRAKMEYDTVNTAKNDLIAENADLQELVSSLEERKEALEKENAELKKSVTDLESKVRNLTTKSEFMDKHIVVVNETDGKKVYHKYGCSYFDSSSFWAYNNEQIKGREGYTKCPHCLE